MKSVIFPLFVSFLSLLGIALLVFPRAVQRIAIRALAEGPTSHLQVIKSFVGSNAYLWNVRFVGMLSLAMSMLLILARLR